MNKVAFCITTFERPEQAQRLIDTILYFYPDANIYIAQDSKQFTQFDNAENYDLSFDVGLSAKRNYLVGATQEEYLLFLDDDFVFTDETNVEGFRDLLDEQKAVGIAGGALREKGEIRHFEGWLRIEGNTLVYYTDYGEERLTDAGDKWFKVGIVFNFMMIRRPVFEHIQWDPKKKLAEHSDFYLNMMDVPYDVAYMPEVIVTHKPERPGDYAKFRNRGISYLSLTLHERGLTKIKHFDGHVSEFPM